MAQWTRRLTTNQEFKVRPLVASFFILVVGFRNDTGNRCYWPSKQQVFFFLVESDIAYGCIGQLWKLQAQQQEHKHMIVVQSVAVIRKKKTSCRLFIILVCPKSVFKQGLLVATPRVSLRGSEPACTLCISWRLFVFIFFCFGGLLSRLHTQSMSVAPMITSLA